MRLDKYLKVSRIIKRRTVAKEVCEAGKIKVNGNVAKAGHEVKAGDMLELSLGSRILTVKITEVKETVKANEADSLYEIISEKKVPREPLI